eukprot:162313-Heterocapsa_arctica.AAC.1
MQSTGIRPVLNRSICYMNILTTARAKCHMDMKAQTIEKHISRVVTSCSRIWGTKKMQISCKPKLETMAITTMENKENNREHHGNGIH